MQEIERKLKKFLEEIYAISLNLNQCKCLLNLYQKQYIDYKIFPYAGKNKPYWTLVKHKLAEMDFGPKNSFLSSYGFMPLDKATSILKAFYKTIGLELENPDDILIEPGSNLHIVRQFISGKN